MQRREAKIGLRDRKRHRRPKERDLAGMITPESSTGSSDKAERSAPLGRSEKSKRPPQRECNSNRVQAVIAVKRAIILLRFDWLTGLIGALLS